MRIILVCFILTAPLFLQAQKPARVVFDSGYGANHIQNKKWFFNSYSGVGVGFNFFNGHAATIVSAPIGLQLNRELNNNVYAFAGVSVAPAYTNFNELFLSPGAVKANGMNSFRQGNLGISSSAYMGLMYVNDARTFFISGSIGVTKSSYPMLLYPAANARPFNSSNPAFR